jgi:2-keto-3-deoxy-L-rhamnonate aldolase RhmA
MHAAVLGIEHIGQLIDAKLLKNSCEFLFQHLADAKLRSSTSLRSSLRPFTRAVDGGAQGIIMPHVDTVEQARRLPEAFRFPPQGSRSWGEAQALFRYRLPSHAEAQAAINNEIMIVALIESMEGVANSASIAAVEGIDVLMVGISDLTTEMGIAGQIAHPRVVDAIEKVGSACRAAGKVLGLGGVYDSENARRYLGMGARFVLTGYDHFYLLAGARARAEILRDAL